MLVIRTLGDISFHFINYFIKLCLLEVNKKYVKYISMKNMEELKDLKT